MNRTAVVGQVSVFEKLFDPGRACPICGSTNSALLATTNEWKYRCRECDVRFNEKGEALK